MTKKIVVQLQGISTYSASKPVAVEKKKKESDADFDDRTWQDKAHYDQSTGEVYLPPMALKNCIADAAQYLSIKTKGNATYTKHFKAGVLVTEKAYLINPKIKRRILIDELRKEPTFVPSNGQAGGGKRVWKNFPCVDEWEATATFYILDDIITESVFLEHLRQAGALIGLGRFRPIRNGYYGRFRVANYEWTEELLAA